jgi:N utilization substance protein A
MNINNLIESFGEFKEGKNIDKTTMMRVVEDMFRAMIRKKFTADENFDVIVNPDKGDIQIFRNRTIVEDGAVEDENTQVAYSEAIKIEPDFEVGEDLAEEMSMDDFGRRNILSARQTLVQKILELEKDNLYKKYKDRIGEIISGEVYQTWKKETLVLDDEGNELLLPRSEMIPADMFKKGDTLRAVVLRVDTMSNTPRIIISRSAPEFLHRLMELEVPEIFDGLITIKAIMREPGERAKVAVESYDDRIDPVGACVGMKGARITGISRELRGENIDVIAYTNNLQLFITRALSPAKITSMSIDLEKRTAKVFLKPDQISLAIGRGGNNIKLAGKLTGFEIDVFRESADGEVEDVDLDEFTDEIDQWIIDEFKNVGLDSARQVLGKTVEDLTRLTELEEETIREVHKILQAEFEE